MDNRPIGVFDSGLGGLTGVRELRRRLPHENIVYFGDTGRVPYGSRSPETILQYGRQDIAFLLSKDVKCIMAACGAVSSTYPAAEAEKLPVALRPPSVPAALRRSCAGWCPVWRSPPGPARSLCRWWKRAMWITAPRTSRRSPSWSLPST